MGFHFISKDIRLDLDPEQIFPDDPEAGCPALVIVKRHDSEYVGTFFCVRDTEEIWKESGGGPELIALTQEQIDFLDRQWDRVHCFMITGDPFGCVE